MKKYFTLICCVLLLSSCASMRINTPMPYEGNLAEKNIGLLPFMIGPLQQPLFPLIDAAAFNAKVNGISDQIMDMQQRTIDTLRSQTKAALEKYYQFNVFTAEDFAENEDYQTMMKKTNYLSKLNIGNNHFPIVQMSKGDFNPFNYPDSDITGFLKEQLKAGPTIRYICEKLKLDGVVVTYTRLNILGVTSFGISGNLGIETYLFVYNNMGLKVSEGSVMSKPVPIKGDNVIDYSNCLKQYSFHLKSLMIKLSGGEI